MPSDPSLLERRARAHQQAKLLFFIPSLLTLLQLIPMLLLTLLIAPSKLGAVFVGVPASEGLDHRLLMFSPMVAGAVAAVWWIRTMRPWPSRGVTLGLRWLEQALLVGMLLGFAAAWAALIGRFASQSQAWLANLLTLGLLLSAKALIDARVPEEIRARFRTMTGFALLSASVVSYGELISDLRQGIEELAALDSRWSLHFPADLWLCVAVFPVAASLLVLTQKWATRLGWMRAVSRGLMAAGLLALLVGLVPALRDGPGIDAAIRGMRGNAWMLDLNDTAARDDFTFSEQEMLLRCGGLHVLGYRCSANECRFRIAVAGKDARDVAGRGPWTAPIETLPQEHVGVHCQDGNPDRVLIVSHEYQKPPLALGVFELGEAGWKTIPYEQALLTGRANVPKAWAWHGLGALGFAGALVVAALVRRRRLPDLARYNPGRLGPDGLELNDGTPLNLARPPTLPGQPAIQEGPVLVLSSASDQAAPYRAQTAAVSAAAILPGTVAQHQTSRQLDALHEEFRIAAVLLWGAAPLLAAARCGLGW